MSSYANALMFMTDPSYPQYANFPQSVHSKRSDMSDFDHLEPISPDGFDHLEDPSSMISELTRELELNEIRNKKLETPKSEVMSTSDIINERQKEKLETRLNLELDSVLGTLETNLDFENRIVTPTYANGPQTHIYNLDKPKPMNYNVEQAYPSNDKQDKNVVKTELKLQKALGKLEKKYTPAGKLDVYEANKSKQIQTNKPQPGVKRKLPKTPEKTLSQPNLMSTTNISQNQQINSRKLPTTNTPRTNPQAPNTASLVKVLPTQEQDTFATQSGARHKRIAPPPPVSQLTNQNSLSFEVTQSLCALPQRTNQIAECELLNTELEF